MGYIHRALLAKSGRVQNLGGVTYEKVDERDKGNSSGEDEARAVIFLSGELVNEGVDVADVAGVECGDMHPKVLLARLPEGRVAQKL